MNTQNGGSSGPSRSHIQSLPSIPVLQGRENWPTWKFAVKTFLEMEDLWDAVKPAKKDDGTYEAVDAVKDRKARTKIVLLVDPLNYFHVNEAKTAREVWSCLEAAFEDSGLTRKVGLLRKLITTSLGNCESMEVYVNSIIATAQQLSGIGFVIGDEWIGTLLLAGLPEDYRPMIMAIENSGLKIGADVIKTKLLQEVSMPSTGAAFAGKKQPWKPKRGPAEKIASNGPKCRSCKKFGHIAKFCPTKASKNENGNAWCTVLSTIAEDDQNWYFDSGASGHFTKTEELLENSRKCGGKVVAANRGAMSVVAKGTVKIYPECCPDDSPIDMHDVQVIPELSVNLISVNQIVKRGHTVTFNMDGVKVINLAGKVIATGIRDNDLFKLDQLVSRRALACSATENLDLWHRRMGHLSTNSLHRLKNGMVTGMQVVDTTASVSMKCKICAMGKQTRLPFPKSGSRASDLLEVVHSDICGPMEVSSLGGSRYYLTFTDDKSRRIFIYFLEEKSGDNVYKAFENFRTMAEKQTGKKLKVLRTDNGKEFVNKQFEDHLQRLGIRHQTSADYTPEQNGMAERGNRTIVERARCMLFEANLPKTFWAEAAATAVYLINRSPTKGHQMTPEEAWSGRKPDLAHVRVFGSPVMAHIPKQKRKKWDAKAFECILTGFDEDTKAYRLWDPTSRKLIKSRDVTFLTEQTKTVKQVNRTSISQWRTISLDWIEATSCESTPNQVPSDVPPMEAVQAEAVEEEILPNDKNDEELADQVEAVPTSSEHQNPTSSEPQVPESPVLRRSGRERYLPDKLRDFFFPSQGMSSNRFPDGVEQRGNTAEGSILIPEPELTHQLQQGLVARDNPSGVSDPRTPAEALRSSKSQQWKDAMDDEYRSMIDNGTWELVELPPDRKPIGCKWLFKSKEDEKGNIVRHKARLVAQGFTQKFGVDFDEVFAPVAKQVSLRTLLTIASRRGMVVKHVDVKTAYLHGVLDETIYMKQPEMYHTGGANTVCLLKKSIYGLKQSARVWNQRIDGVFKSMQFVPSKADPCLYVKKKGGRVSYIIIYVDDVIIATQTEEEFMKIFEVLQKNFTMTNLGDVKHFLGINIRKESGRYTLCQHKYIRKLVDRFDLQNAKPSKIPLDPAYLQQKEEECPLPNNSQYLSLIGGLLYVAVNSRPDVSASVSILAQKSSCPTQRDWQEAKRVLRYLHSTSQHRLHLGSTSTGLEMFVDADWASNQRDRKSNSGFIIRFGGGLISWASRKQGCVSLSSTEAELVALTEGCQELSWIKKLLRDFGEDVSSPVPTYEDNQSCIKIVEGDKIEKRTKHIDTKYFYVRDLNEMKEIALLYCPTEVMLADILTKPLQNVRIKMLREKIGVLPDLAEEEY